jgi:hypothetical protein
MGGKVAALLLTAAVVAGCGGADPPAHADRSEPAGAAAPTSAAEPAAGGEAKGGQAEHDGKEEAHSVVLTPEERGRLGITTASAQAVTFTPSATAFAVVLSHDSIAQVVTDLQMATSAAHLSQTALARAQKLAGGPGALGVDTLETLQKQAATDRTTLSMARYKLTSVLGVRFPWQGAAAGGVLNALAAGESKLVRATFPSGVLTGQTPGNLQLVPLDPGAGNTSWTASPVWAAPQDTTLPGRSFFALLKKADLPEGSRFQALSGASGNDLAGVLIPASAVVISNGEYWCFVEKPAGTFTRVSINVDKPLGQGYFVSDGVEADDKVVTAGAGLLLARQTNSGSESAD